MAQQEKELRPQRKGPPAGWRYPAQAEHRSRLRGRLAQVWRGTKNNAALVSLVGVLLTLLVTTLLTQIEWARQQNLEHQRAQDAARVADQQAQQESLQTYLDQIDSLLLDRELRSSQENSEVRTLAQAKTLTVLLGLEDPQSKRIVVQFLYEASLIDKENPVVSLSDIRLHGTDLSGADLSNAHLREAALHDADLFRANLGGADLIRADLSGADLSGAFLESADLSAAYLVEANLSDAYLQDANLSDAPGITKEQLEKQTEHLNGATMSDGSKHP